MRKLLSSFAAPAIALLVSACSKPPAAPVAYEATPIKASFGRTWAATLDELSRRTIPIKSVDRESGVIITDVLYLDASYHPNADCGSPGSGQSEYVPTQGTFSVLVRGDSSQSSVRVNVRWVSVGSGNAALCSTRGTWEQGFQAAVRDAAERRP